MTAQTITRRQNSQDHYWDHIVRIDHNLSAKQRFYVRMDITEKSPRKESSTTMPSATNFTATTGACFRRRLRGFPTFFINTRYTLTRFIRVHSISDGWDLAGLGFSSNFIDQIKQVDPSMLRLPNFR